MVNQKKQIETVRKYLEDSLTLQEKRIKKTMKVLEEKIQGTLDDLKRTKGKLVTGKLAFKQAQGVHQQIINNFGRIFEPEMKDIVKDYVGLEGVVKKYLKGADISAAFLTVNKDAFKALREMSFKVYKTLSDQTVNKIAQSVYNSVLTGGSFKNLTNQITAAIVGYEDVKGRPLEIYARTYAQDSLMQYYSTIQSTAMKESGLEFFLYQGTVMRETRPFCTARAGKVFSKEEIDSWNDMDWAGKAPGDVWINRGGYNCRHFFIPVKSKQEEETEE